MENVIKIFREIQVTSGKNDKQSIIERNKSNELFKKCLIFLFDGNVTTGISKAKISKNTGNMVNQVLTTFEDVIEYIAENNTGKDCNIADIQGFIDNQPDEYREFYREMVTKSLTIGCDYKSVNKVIPNLIRTWEVMLGSTVDKCKIKPNDWISLSRKLNGNRCSYYKGKLISRQGKIFSGMQHIVDEINSVGLQNMFIDGELIGKNLNGLSDGENFRLCTGIINSDAESKDEIELVVFDIFPADEFDTSQSKLTYKNRVKYLEMLEDTIKNNGLSNIKVVERLYSGTDHSQIDKWLDYAVEHDWEGCMINLDDCYKCKRVTTLCKVKRFYTMDLKVINVEEGDGRLKNTLGALVVEFKGNTVNCGSGFTDEQRTEIWNNRENIIGRVAEIKYKEVTKDKGTGLESLQFPIFVCIREIGKEVSYN